MSIHIQTIGFSKKSLREFVGLLKSANVTKLVDTRLNNTSQLAGFAKKNDLAYVMELVHIDYVHDLSLAPTADLLHEYKKKFISWEEYHKRYLDLLVQRKIEEKIDEIIGKDQVCFLCSEHKPHHCHRKVLAEYIREYKKNVKIVHL